MWASPPQKGGKVTAVIIPEPKKVSLQNQLTKEFDGFALSFVEGEALSEEEAREIASIRFWDYPELLTPQSAPFALKVVGNLPDIEVDKPELFREQGYVLEINEDHGTLRYAGRAGLVNGLTTVKMLVAARNAENGFLGGPYRIELGQIVDYPSIPVRAVAATFSWYAGYGRIGFDMQLWGLDRWKEYLQHLLDSKINQVNMVMYGYWPFEFPKYPETVFRDVGLDIWNQENEQWLQVSFSHPNVVHDFLPEFLELAHKMGVRIMAYVGLNSYNGARSIVDPSRRMVPPAGSDFLNDFDSLCLSDDENVQYILDSMRRIASLGFDGFTLEESEEGFWFCECEQCLERWHKGTTSAWEAKHSANMWLLRQIYDTVREVNPEAIIGIRAFRQPPLEKSPEFLEDAVASMPDDVNLFWAPALYVPEAEFHKWVDAFGKHRVWGRDSESNSITSTMGRLYRTFESNILRYEDEANTQTIERDIEQHIGSVEADVHGINGFMFEWYGLFMHQWAHGNYGWGSKMPQEEFFSRACQLTFGGMLGESVLRVLQDTLTIHESQLPFYETPFPFQANKVEPQDLPAIAEALAGHGELLAETKGIEKITRRTPKLNTWAPHFSKLVNAQRRNKIIYSMALAGIEYAQTSDPKEKERLLYEILAASEEDFSIAQEMFFDLNPVSKTGVKSSMMPHHELKRTIHNLLNPEERDDDLICSGIEALGWLWLAHDKVEEESDNESA